MATGGRPSMNKRRKELERRQKQEQKFARRAQRSEEAKNRPSGQDADADIAWIVPGRNRLRKTEPSIGAGLADEVSDNSSRAINTPRAPCAAAGVAA